MCCLLAWFGFVHTGNRLQRSLVDIQSFDMKRVILEWTGVKDSDAECTSLQSAWAHRLRLKARKKPSLLA